MANTMTMRMTVLNISKEFIGWRFQSSKEIITKTTFTKEMGYGNSDTLEIEIIPKEKIVIGWID